MTIRLICPDCAIISDDADTLAAAGSELVQFSPSEKLHAVERAMIQNMRAMQNG